MNARKAKALRKQAGGNEAVYDVNDTHKVVAYDPVTKEPVIALTHVYTLTADCSRKKYKQLKSAA